MAVSDRIAVMNQGTVVQEGSAADLYHRPASEFVARFVGRVNIVAGRVEQVVGESLRIGALGSVFSVYWSDGGFAPGDTVRLVVRPEAIEIVGATAGLPQATVESRMFLGEKIEYLLRCGNETLQAVRYNVGPGEVPADGATVSLRVAEHALTVLAPDPA